MKRKFDLNLPVQFRDETFDNFSTVCYAYGLSPKYVQRFLENEQSLNDALSCALHFKDIQTFYGMTLNAYKMTQSMINLVADDDKGRYERIIETQQKARVEQLNQIRHNIVVEKFVECVTKIEKYIDYQKINCYH